MPRCRSRGTWVLCDFLKSCEEIGHEGLQDGDHEEEVVALSVVLVDGVGLRIDHKPEGAQLQERVCALAHAYTIDIERNAFGTSVQS